MTALNGLLAFAFAALASLVATPLAARVAVRLGAIDAPDGRRKNQLHAIPLGGGLAIALAAATGMAGAMLAGGSAEVFSGTGLWAAALPSAAVLIFVGVVDDTIGLTGIYKLIGQMLAASLLAAAGFHFESVSLIGMRIPLGDFAVPFSIFFCLGAINAFNLIDGADGLAASIGAVVCLTLGVIAGAQGAVVAALASFGLSGALVGFLRYNAPPARVYLGDTGSMLIGWLVAAVAIRCSIKEQAVVALAVPVAICAIPILDAAAALVRRVTTGQSVFTTDRGHLHHALLLRGWSAGQTATLAAGLTAITCAGAIASYFTSHEFFAIATVGGVILALAGARVFGHAELALLRSHVHALTRGAWHHLRPAPRPEGFSDHVIQLQGRRHWNILWGALREAAPVYRLASLTLNVNIPHLHESFFARWRASDAPSDGAAWRVTLPLSCGERSVGRLSVEGRSCGGQGLADMQKMLDFLEPLEGAIARIADEAVAELADDDASAERSAVWKRRLQEAALPAAAAGRP